MNGHEQVFVHNENEITKPFALLFLHQSFIIFQLYIYMYILIYMFKAINELSVFFFFRSCSTLVNSCGAFQALGGTFSGSYWKSWTAACVPCAFPWVHRLRDWMKWRMGWQWFVVGFLFNSGIVWTIKIHERWKASMEDGNCLMLYCSGIRWFPHVLVFFVVCVFVGQNCQVRNFRRGGNRNTLIMRNVQEEQVKS